ncbi:zinc finger protein 658B-like isoform X1 [Danaus plexippus]|uniref:zinc finger protein 658B-like isoform X1 n=1 Tax=Danaus plexippus TaxID=13037 RepID=UPI002AB1871E|nr:zinc finger protein 658B-like isoform X1 [Danaus plexippus]
MLQCCYCSKKFKYESEKKRHEKSHDPQFECDKCSKKFSFLSALKRHQKQHERTGSVKCTECGKYFLDKTLLNRHMKYAHQGTYVCSKCEATFSSDLALASHQKSHKPRSERRFKCNYDGCTKTFNYIHHLKHHQLSHTNKKQHYCNVCGKGFIQYHHFKAHRKVHSPETWLPCTIPGCSKQFPDEYARKQHLMKHKGADGPSSDCTSNFSHTSDIKESPDEMLCSSCGDMIEISSQATHLEKCKTNTRSKHSLTNLEDLNISNNNNNNEDIKNINDGILDVFIDSKKYINNPKNTDNSDYYSMVGSLNFNDDIKGIPSDSSNVACEGCDCYTKDIICGPRNDKDLPQIEYRSDGVIKLKDTLETDVPKAFKTNKLENEEFYINEVPYNSCKTILGGCIVSGDGTISEGCLCAKMALNEQEAVEQEIDEITPRPVTSTA